MNSGKLTILGKVPLVNFEYIHPLGDPYIDLCFRFVVSLDFFGISNSESFDYSRKGDLNTSQFIHCWRIFTKTEFGGRDIAHQQSIHQKYIEISRCKSSLCRRMQRAFG